MKDNETINKRVHTEIMGKCWHQWDGVICECGAVLADRHQDDNPDYCASLDLAATVEAVVIEKNWLKYDEALREVTEGELFCGLLYTATAKQRMVACLAAWGRGGD